MNIQLGLLFSLLCLPSVLAAQSDLVFDTGMSSKQEGMTVTYYQPLAPKPAPAHGDPVLIDQRPIRPYSIKIPKHRPSSNAATRVGKAFTRGFWKALVPGLSSKVLPR